MISFIVPTLNEKNNIENTVKKINSSFSEKKNYEIIFVDDKSNDGSLEIIKRLSKDNDNIDYITPEKKLGLVKLMLIKKLVYRSVVRYHTEYDKY